MIETGAIFQFGESEDGAKLSVQATKGTMLAASPVSIPAGAPTDYEYPLGFVSFVIGELRRGEEVTLAIESSEAYANARIVKCFSTGGCAEFGQTLGNNNFSIQLRDGQPEDADGIINGQIEDPFAIAIPLQTAPTPSASPEPSPSPTMAPTASPTPSAQPTPPNNLSPTPSPSPTPTRVPTPTPTPTSTPTPTPTSTPTPAPTPSTTPTPVADRDGDEVPDNEDPCPDDTMPEFDVDGDGCDAQQFLQNILGGLPGS